MTVAELCRKAADIRIKILQMCVTSGGHIASALSCVDILVALYYGGLKFDGSNPEWDDRDRFILSKGHGETALYAVLSDLGVFPDEWITSRYRKGDCFLGGHPDKLIPGVEVTTGALGHGIGIAAGISLAAKMDGGKHLQYVLVGDAECTEGSIWESALFASKHKLNNLIAIVDRNHIGALEFTTEFTSLDPLGDKWKAFGWEVSEVDGHDMNQLTWAIQYSRTRTGGRPLVFIAETVKGKGISFVENDPSWHTRSLTPAEIDQASRELGGRSGGNHGNA